MRAYSRDLRERVLADCDAGLSNDEVARKFSVSASWIRRLKQRRRETGSIDPRPHRSPTSRLLAYGPRICELVRSGPTPPWRSCAKPWACPPVCRPCAALSSVCA